MGNWENEGKGQEWEVGLRCCLFCRHMKLGDYISPCLAADAHDFVQGACVAVCVCVDSETGRPNPASYVRTRSSPLQGDRASVLA